MLNNVGLLAVDGPEELDEGVWDHHMRVNVKGAFLSCKYVLPVMVKQGKGVVINVSSIASIRYTGYPSAVYNASKGALNQLTKHRHPVRAERYSSELYLARAHGYPDDS